MALPHSPHAPLAVYHQPDWLTSIPGKGPESPQSASEAAFTVGCVRVRAWLTKLGLRLEASSRCCAVLRPACVHSGRLPETVPFDEILSASVRERGCLPSSCCRSKRVLPKLCCDAALRTMDSLLGPQSHKARRSQPLLMPCCVLSQWGFLCNVQAKPLPLVKQHRVRERLMHRPAKATQGYYCLPLWCTLPHVLGCLDKEN